MVFSSILFTLFFLPLFLIIYNLTPKKLKNFTFLVFSLIFYAWGAPVFVFILTASTIANFYLVQWLYNIDEKRKKRLVAGISIFINLGLLAYFKYANFFVENVNMTLSALGWQHVEWTRVALPIGISFFTFQSLTYTIDVYRRIHSPLKNPFDYLLYIIMFPQLIAGPIVRFESIADQLQNRRETNDERLTGFYRFVIGLAKKVLIADVLGMEVNRVMEMDFHLLDSTTAWIGILAYTFQIYFDFSGYSDMAIGIGRMVGFKFPENFDNPYTAKSITDFWRRWHMTFTTFMRLYLYYPLGGNRVSTKRRLYFNLVFVFFVSGLWHGASWNFILWGLIHGLFLILDRVFLLRFIKKSGAFFGWLYTFFVVVLAWVPFRVEGINNSMLFYRKMFEFNFSSLYLQFIQNRELFVILVVAFFISILTLSGFGTKLQHIFYKTGISNKQHPAYFSVALVLFILCIATLAGSGFSPFIYFRF
ncbi:MAG: MBOAT family protein [Bacteroidales bacterium]|nr:MBOAT family protein [Bacteroidales bacterium]